MSSGVSLKHKRLRPVCRGPAVGNALSGHGFVVLFGPYVRAMVWAEHPGVAPPPCIASLKVLSFRCCGQAFPCKVRDFHHVRI